MNISESQAEADYYTICSEQNWNDYVQTIHLEAFIKSKGLMAEFAEYCREAQEEENA